MGPMDDAVPENRIKWHRGLPGLRHSTRSGTPHEGKVVEDILDQFPVLSHAGNKFHAMLAASSIPEADQLLPLVQAAVRRKMHVTALFDPNVDNTERRDTQRGRADRRSSPITTRLFGKEFVIPTWPAMKKDITARLSHKRPYLAVDQQRTAASGLICSLS